MFLFKIIINFISLNYNKWSNVISCVIKMLPDHHLWPHPIVLPSPQQIPRQKTQNLIKPTLITRRIIIPILTKPKNSIIIKAHKTIKTLIPLHLTLTRWQFNSKNKPQLQASRLIINELKPNIVTLKPRHFLKINKI